MDQFRKTPRARFLDYDYGDYFITICTREMAHYFGEIIDDEMRYSTLGDYCREQLENAGDICRDIRMIVYTVMPNHIHAIVRVNRVDTCHQLPDTCHIGRSVDAALRFTPEMVRHVPPLTRYINSFKGAVTRYARRNRIPFGWHGRYHDHFIRGVHDGDNIYQYIVNNVLNWGSDCFHR